MFSGWTTVALLYWRWDPSFLGFTIVSTVVSVQRSPISSLYSSLVLVASSFPCGINMQSQNLEEFVQVGNMVFFPFHICLKWKYKYLHHNINKRFKKKNPKQCIILKQLWLMLIHIYMKHSFFCKYIWFFITGRWKAVRYVIHI